METVDDQIRRYVQPVLLNSALNLQTGYQKRICIYIAHILKLVKEQQELWILHKLNATLKTIMGVTSDLKSYLMILCNNRYDAIKRVGFFIDKLADEDLHKRILKCFRAPRGKSVPAEYARDTENRRAEYKQITAASPKYGATRADLDEMVYLLETADLSAK